jgi:hypothetical protein
LGKENTQAHLKMYFALKYHEIMQILSFKTNLKAFVTLKPENTSNHFGARLFIKSNQNYKNVQN